MSAIGDLERLLAGTDDSQLLRLEAKRLRQALAKAEQRGAERERAAVVRYLTALPWRHSVHAASNDIESGKHREGEDELP